MSEVQPDAISRLIAPSSATVTLEHASPLSTRLNKGLLAAHAAPRCSAHSSRTGKPCKLPAIRGMTVCTKHGGQAPQVRAAAALRLAMAADPMVRELVLIGKNRKHRHQMQAIKEVLERNDLRGYGAPLRASGDRRMTVNTQVNVLPEARLDAMSDDELDRYERLINELRELVPANPPKLLSGNVRR